MAAEVMSPEDARWRRTSIAGPEGVVAGLTFGGDEPDAVFLHATGFNARAYAQLLAPLGERAALLALDLRGHGRTTLPAATFGYASWNRHRDDVIAVLLQLGRKVTLIGHSLGATTALLVAGARPDLVRGLCLIEPVIVPPSLYALAAAPGSPLAARRFFGIARGAARRRPDFESFEAAVEALRGRGVFKSFSEEALRDYLADGLAARNGRMALTCRPAYEAATFSALRHDPWGAFKRAPAPIFILRAERGSTFPAPLPQRLLRKRPDIRIATVEGAGHMLPFERPDRVRAAIESTLVITTRARYGVAE